MPLVQRRSWNAPAWLSPLVLMLLAAGVVYNLVNERWLSMVVTPEVQVA